MPPPDRWTRRAGLLIRKLGTIDCDLVETTPVVFQGRLYRSEWVRTSYKRNELGDNYSRLVEVSTGKPTAPFARGFIFSSAFVWDDTVYVTATHTSGRRVDVFASKDLQNWEQWTALDLEGFRHLQHVALPGGRSVRHDVRDRQAGGTGGRRFTAQVRHVEGPAHVDAHAAGVRLRQGPLHGPALPSLPGRLLLRFLPREHPRRLRDASGAVQGPDPLGLQPAESGAQGLARGQADRQSEAHAEERERIAKADNINNSDIDFCEYKGRLVINYSWGNQQGKEFLAQAEYDGTVEQFLTGWFPPAREQK